MSERVTTCRCMISGGFLMLALLGLGTRLAFLHIGSSEKVRVVVNQRRQLQKTLLAGRGRIFDRNGSDNILALNLGVDDVCADPALIVQTNMVAEVASVLADTLDLPTDVVAVKLQRPKRRFAYVKRYVLEETVESIRTQNLPGVFFRETTVRHYPHREFMCHVLGFVNYNGVGSSGVEQVADRYLKGSPGVLESHLNGLRQEVYSQRERHVPALEGADVTLTIDQNVQFIVESALRDTVREYEAAGGWVIVQHVRTGEILAMASEPSFDLNAFRHTAPEKMLNRAIGYVYEPGSTLKAAILAATLNEGLVSPDTVVDCENGAWFYGGRILHDFHAYGDLTVADGLKKSSNILHAKLALSLGDNLLYRYLRNFGLGRPLGVDLPGEEAGILHPPHAWSKLSPTRIAIGQGVAVTALQMLGVFCTIANDGFLMRPHIIRSIRAVDGTVLVRNEPEVLGRPISFDTAETMRRLLSRVTEEGGTGRRAALDGIPVAGKTGTAQKPEDGGYSDENHVASFVGFLPADQPEIGIIVVIDEPRDIHTGGRVAGPAFKVIADQTIRYLDVASPRMLYAADGRRPLERLEQRN